jgi:hypothetical protein
MEPIRIDWPEVREHEIVRRFECWTGETALGDLQECGAELARARARTRQVMRWTREAVLATRNLPGEERPTKEAIIRVTGLARQTIYDILGTNEEA